MPIDEAVRRLQKILGDGTVFGVANKVLSRWTWNVGEICVTYLGRLIPSKHRVDSFA
jgi:hypothetical protein